MQTSVDPDAPVFTRANRAFIGRAIRFLAGAGIRQFLDIGSGIPTEGNVHEVAQAADRDSRVAYVEVDPVAIAHSKAILAGDDHAAIIDADLREPEEILTHPATGQMIDFSQPVGCCSSPSCTSSRTARRIRGESSDAPRRTGPRQLPGRGARPPTRTTRQPNEAFEKMYNRSVSTRINLRRRADILRFFDGFTLVDPGLVYVSLWRPDSPADVPDDPSRYGNLVGVAQKAS